MMNKQQLALIKKDVRGITSNKRLFSVLLIIPLFMAVVLPTIFLLTITFTPLESGDLQDLLAILPVDLPNSDLRVALTGALLNKIVPLFFLMIPIMSASVMAASSFVGEKEKRTLETLLYCPLSLKQIYRAKILASFALSMFVSLLSFAAMLIVVEAELWITMRNWFLPAIEWLLIILLVAPALSLIAITLIVRGSAKAQTVEESQQRSVFLILPILMLIVGQFMGVLLLNAWILLGLGAAFAAIAVVLVRTSAGGYTYEKILK
ncbi:MAG: ABC transporter permease [Propionibacteriaceae bacterium]|jgi:ABC-type Na+ efflux pump permease subunit|nr:ABC transporter permease [Propionibacteriaceae bacterium]